MDRRGRPALAPRDRGQRVSFYLTACRLRAIGVDVDADPKKVRSEARRLLRTAIDALQE